MTVSTEGSFSRGKLDDGKNFFVNKLSGTINSPV